MNRTTKVIIGIASVASLALAGCSSNTSTEDASTNSGGIEGFKAGYIDGFMKATANSGLSEQQRSAVAECGWRGVQKDISLDELKELDINPDSDQSKATTKKIEKIGVACQSDVNAY